MNRKVILPISFRDRKSVLFFGLIIVLAILAITKPENVTANGNSEIYEVNFMLNQGPNDLMWGSANPGTTVTVEKNSVFMFSAYADPSCGGCWENDMPHELSPGDEITITGTPGLYPVTVTIPDPLDVYADSTSESVWGQIGGWVSDGVEIFGSWEGGYQAVVTNTEGIFSATYVNIPRGGAGEIIFTKEEEGAAVNFHVQFRSLDLILEVNYKHDWIRGYYEPGHTVWLTLYESDGVTTKGSIEVTSGPLSPDIQTGFTTVEASWSPEGPDISPGDWVYALGDNGYHTWVRVGSISGEVDLAADENSGKVNVPWLPQEELVDVICVAWDAPLELDNRLTTVFPDNIDEYLCSWSSSWDIQPSQQIAVAYLDPGGYENPDETTNNGGNFVYNVFVGYLDELMMTIHYGYDWVEGLYEAGHEIVITVMDGGMAVKGEITLVTDEIDAWDKRSGFATWLDGSEWLPERPDIQPGDTIHGEVDDGSEFWDDVKIAEILGEVDVSADSITGTIAGSWLMPGPVEVECSIWGEVGPENEVDSVIPNGEDQYTCSWSGWDLQYGDVVQVAYYELEGHKVIKNILAPVISYIPIFVK